MRTRRFAIPLGLAVLALLPLRGDGGQAECCNASSSLASSINDPVAGDEAFFKLPTGPANVMLLFDVSGSMEQFPQCGDYGWDENSSTLPACKTPSTLLPNPSNSTDKSRPDSKALWRVEGTCLPSGGDPSHQLAWMEKITPTRNKPDPGRSNALLVDAPPWGDGCTGNACLFDPDAYYLYGDWSASATGSSATRRASDVDGSLPNGCIALDDSGKVIRANFQVSGQYPAVDLGQACRDCMAERGFYFYRVRLATSRDSQGYITGWQSNSDLKTRLLFKGTFLNANPPKFVAAKKVIKDLAWMDPDKPQKLDQVRLALAILSYDTYQKAKLVVPFGPAKDSAFPPTQDKFRQSRQYILSVLNYDKNPYWVDGKKTVNDQTITFFDPTQSGTPLAGALFAVGQYFSSSGLYTTKFGSSYELNGLKETATGLVQAPWAVSAGTSQCSICWSCQNNSVVLLTDGSPSGELSFPTSTTSGRVNLNTWDNTVFTSDTNCGSNGSKCIAPQLGKASVLPRVASWLHNTDLRDDKVMAQDQALTIHTIGFGAFDAGATTGPEQILRATANMGGGLFQTAKDLDELKDAVFNAVSAVIPKENSFSAASANSLQTVQTASSEAYMTRFKPNQSITWEGHVFQGMLFDEFLNGCDPTKAPEDQPTVTCGTTTVSANFNGDADPVTGNARCDGVFLVDLDCDEVAEDVKTGDFVKKGKSERARFPWDGGEVLSNASKPGYRSADETASNKRNIFTWVNGQKVELVTSNWDKLLPYMNIDAAWCSSFLTRIGRSGVAAADQRRECTKEIIHFVRGWDVLDQDSDGCYAPSRTNPPSCPSGSKGEERNRANDGNNAENKVFWKLGDIFHSSPAVIQAPIDPFRCDTGYEKQCIATLRSPAGLGPAGSQTEMEKYEITKDGKTVEVDAYSAYRHDNIQRQRLVLVGANDGMLHAFAAGNAFGSPDFTGSYPYDNGNGEELWAFVPPDMLPRLKGLVDQHQYMVDGSVMLRDVWVDLNKNFKKEKNEFKTVAIVGRRSGGNAYSALDVTDPADPKFLWNFPGTGSSGCCDDAKYMGQSWADFAPRPPPIGPVRLANDGDPRGWEERWIVMINGGYDPTLNLGRAVFMLDVWTGKTLWRFTDDDFKAQFGYGEGTSMFPVPGAVALADVGDPQTSRLDMDGYFDTATWGDMGGNVWVARFHEPGVIDETTKRVKNWHAARTFEQQRRTDNLQNVSGRSEFFFMPALTFEPTSRSLRAYLGSGNREQIMQQGAACGPDNLMACCQAGCTLVRSKSTKKWGACDSVSTFTCENGMLRRSTSASTACGPEPVCAADGALYEEEVKLEWECPGAGAITDVNAWIRCDGSGLCTQFQPVGTKSITGTFSEPPRNRFYGIWAYGKDPKKMFKDAASAKDFDENRFTDVSFSGTCSGPTGGSCTLVNTTDAKVTYTSDAISTSCEGGATKCTATTNDAGWFYDYGRRCPLGKCAEAPPWNDEKTGSGATVVLGCTAWGGFRPYGVETTTDPCSGELGTPVTYGYVAHYISGAPSRSCGFPGEGVIARATQRSTTAPPTGATVRVTFNPEGAVSYSALHIDAGSPPTNTSMGIRTEMAEPVYWLEVSRQLHGCRHESANRCQ